MANRVRNRYGVFVTPEEKAREDAKFAQKFAAEFPWVAPETVYEYADGFKLVAVRAIEDLRLLGSVQGHCSGSHYHWAGELQIEHIMTILKPTGAPCGTFHAKDVEWFGKPHPDDDLGNLPKDRAWTSISESKVWGSSTYYEGDKTPEQWVAYNYVVPSKFNQPINILGHKALFISINTGYNLDELEGQLAVKFEQFYEANKE